MTPSGVMPSEPQPVSQKEKEALAKEIEDYVEEWREIRGKNRASMYGIEDNRRALHGQAFKVTTKTQLNLVRNLAARYTSCYRSHPDAGKLPKEFLKALEAFNRCIDNAMKSHCEAWRAEVREEPSTEPIIVGKWVWFNRGVVTVNRDGTMTHHLGGKKRNSGTWRLIDAAERKFELKWKIGGWIDTLTLSLDGKKLKGTNNRGTPVSGTRR